MLAGPYFYLPKMQSHLEARLWNDVFVEAQAELGVPRGSIRVLSRSVAHDYVMTATEPQQRFGVRLVCQH